MSKAQHQIVTPRGLFNEMVLAIHAGNSTLAIGGPGIAKTAVATQVAKHLDMKFTDFRGATSDPTELFGYQAPDIPARKLVHCIPELLPTENDPPTLVFIDEINTGTQTQMNAYLGFLNEGRVGSYQLADHHAVGAAGNLAVHGAAVQEIPIPLVTRVESYFVEPSLSEWKEDFAFKGNIHSDVLAHLALFPDEFWKPDYDAEDCTSHANPRTWELASKKCHAIDTYPELATGSELPRWIGIVGPGVGEQFAGTRKSRADLVSPLEALLNPDTARVPETVAGKWIIASALAAIANDENLAGLIRYIERVGPEMSALAMRDSSRRNPGITENVEFQKWISENNEIFNNAF